MKTSPPAKIPAASIGHWSAWICVLGVLAVGRLCSAQPPATGEYQVYALKNKAAGEVEKSLGEILARLGTTTHLVADPRNNQLLLRGPDTAQQVARQFIASVDRPTPVQPPSPPLVRAYPCGQIRPIEMADRLRALCPNRDQVRIAPDLDGGQVFVVAPAEVHATIAQQLQSGASAPPGLPVPTAKPDELPSDHFVPLAYVRVEQLTSILQNLVQPRLVRPPEAARSGADLVFLDVTGRRVELKLDANRNGLGLSGPAPLVGQFVRLIQSLDHPAPTPGQALRVIPVRKVSPAKVEEAIKAYQMGRPALDDSSQHAPAHGAIGLVGYLFQSADETAGKAAGSRSAVQSIPATDAKAEQTRRVIRALGSEVEVEVLPDLDVIILRGRERDVEEVTRIIAELERLSAETQPVIEVYPLKHIGGESLVTIVAKVNESLVGGRQGRVSLTPLVKPNALLMIGWGEAIKATKELLEKLDQPVPPEAEFRVFPLKHAPAAATQTVVQGFFTGRTGLSSHVLVTADPRTNSLIVQAAPRELDEAARLIEGLDRSDSAAVSQTRIFKLKNSLAADLATTLQAAIDGSRGGTGGTGAAAAKSSVLELITVDAQGQKILKSGMPADVRVTADSRLNTLLVTCPAESMELMAALIQQLDTPASAAQIKVFRIVNGDAGSLIMMLRSLMVTSTTAGPQLAVAEGESGLAALRFSIDMRTNSIIAVGSPGDLKIVEALLLRLDEQDVQQRKNEVYRLKNAPAMDVASAINEFLRSERQVQQAAPGATSPFQQIESEVVVVPEVVSNALIISATPRFFEEIHKLVEELDAQPLQVLIQVLIAQVDLDNFNELGVELGLQDSILYDRGLLGNLVSTTVTNAPAGNTTVQNYTGSPPNNPARVGGSGLSNFNLGRNSSDLGFGGLVLSASSESVTVLIRAMEQNHCLEVLSRPQVMTLDNQPAFIQVGQRVPRIVGTAVNQVGSVNSITLENVGLILSVTPRISPEGMVVMEIDAEKSKVGPVEEGIPVSTSQGVTIKSPNIDVTTAQTTVSANSGQTIMLGGLITKEHEVTDRRVPLLADIPIVGNLFKYKRTRKTRSELLIILTPHVIRNTEDAERAKQIEVARMHWTLGDVLQLYGDIGVSPNNALPHGGATVYPDANPRGIVPYGPQAPKPSAGVPAEGPAEPVPAPAGVPSPRQSDSRREAEGTSSAGAAVPALRVVPEGEASAPAAASVPTAPAGAPTPAVVPTAHFETTPSGAAPSAVQAIPNVSYPPAANLPLSSYPQTPY